MNRPEGFITVDYLQKAHEELRSTSDQPSTWGLLNLMADIIVYLEQLRDDRGAR
jgi:hypothetical protein